MNRKAKLPKGRLWSMLDVFLNILGMCQITKYLTKISPFHPRFKAFQVSLCFWLGESYSNIILPLILVTIHSLWAWSCAGFWDTTHKFRLLGWSFLSQPCKDFLSPPDTQHLRFPRVLLSGLCPLPQLSGWTWDKSSPHEYVKGNSAFQFPLFVYLLDVLSLILARHVLSSKSWNPLSYFPCSVIYKS